MLMMKSMELSDDEQLDASYPIPMPDKPKYPPGLRICLTEKEMEKLRLDPSVAPVGGIVHFEATAAITSVSCNETESGDCCRIELQIHEIGMEAEDDDDPPAKPRASAKALYDRS